MGMFLLLLKVGFLTLGLNEAHAGDSRLHLKYGLGLATGGEVNSATRYVMAATYIPITENLFYQHIEVGGWVDRRRDIGRSNSFFGSYGIASRTKAGPFYGQAAVGLGFVGAPDTALGGSFPQFYQDFGVGIQGSNGMSLGIHFKHISSGGIHTPNMGRDLLGVDLGYSF